MGYAFAYLFSSSEYRAFTDEVEGGGFDVVAEEEFVGCDSEVDGVWFWM